MVDGIWDMGGGIGIWDFGFGIYFGFGSIWILDFHQRWPGHWDFGFVLDLVVFGFWIFYLVIGILDLFWIW